MARSPYDPTPEGGGYDDTLFQTGQEPAEVTYPLPELFPYAEPIVQGQLGPQGSIQQAFIQPQAQMQQVGANLSNLSRGPRQLQLSERIAGGFAPSTRAPGPFDARAESNRQFNQAARRFREQALPGLAARGLTKSGPGISAELQGLEELSVAFADRDFERELSGFNANMARYQTMSTQEREAFNANVAAELGAYDRELAAFGQTLNANQLAAQAALGLAALNQMPIELQQRLLTIIASQGGTAPVTTPSIYSQIFAPINPTSAATAGATGGG